MGPAIMPRADFNTENYSPIQETEFSQARTTPLSTFSIDVDTASYSNTRRFLTEGTRPPADSVRVEELINYFSYDYPAPRGAVPFSVSTEVSDCPWNPEARLVHIGLQGKTLSNENVPARNLVFLLDVSGSMSSPDKLPLLKRGMSLLTQTLRPQDKVSIAVYAGASGLVLPPTSGSNQARIMEALDRLEAGGSTNGGAGIELAYEVATRGFVKGGINRVILATDGDFNVGTTSEGDLQRLIEKKRKTGVFLTVLGFGSGNLKDSTMETLADKGNGNYAYIDSIAEARKALVREAGSTLVTIAKDVKLQVEFNPALVESYRLVGYENRKLADRDFNDDTKDAGEIGAGHTVTALYEVISTNRGARPASVDPLKYQKSRELAGAASSGELLTLKIRYKAPNSETSRLLSEIVRDDGRPLSSASETFRFSAAVAEFGLLLRQSKFAEKASLAQVRSLAGSALGSDPHGTRHEFITLVEKARSLNL
jgi:Ca-activated chloride channel family protein